MGGEEKKAPIVTFFSPSPLFYLRYPSSPFAIHLPVTVKTGAPHVKLQDTTRFTRGRSTAPHSGRDPVS